MYYYYYVHVYAFHSVFCVLLQTKLICQYVFNLAKYDQNYDIRDRARFLRQLVLPADVSYTV